MTYRCYNGYSNTILPNIIVCSRKRLDKKRTNEIFYENQRGLTTG